MRLTLNVSRPETEQDTLVTIEIFPDMPVSTLRETIFDETGIPANFQTIYHSGVLVSDDSRTLEQLQIVDGDVLAVHSRPSNIPRTPDASTSAAEASRYEQIRQQIMQNPTLLGQLRQTNPALAAAIHDPVLFSQIVAQSANQESRARSERQNQISQLNNDPFDVESQARIQEMIRQERVMENLQQAMEHAPEVFGRVHMLYIEVEINNHKIKAMVDSGAQATVMSPGCAEACGIMRLVDRRFSGIARGVGTATIIGRVHLYQIKLGDLFLPCSFTVMEGKTVDLLIGLDMLKRHQAIINLAHDKLIIQGQEVPFLSEAEIPNNFEVDDEPTIPGPSGTTIGQRTGAVSGPTQPGSSQPFVSSQQAAQSQSQSQSQPQLQSQAQPQTPSQAQAAASSSSEAPPPSTEALTFPEKDITRLMTLGFGRNDAIEALRAAGGNIEVAAGLLFGV